MNNLKIVMDKNHKYTINGLKVPGVNEVLQDLGFIDLSHIPEHILNHASERGSIVHECVEFDLKNMLDYKSICPEVQPYFDAYLDFKSDFDLIPIEIEKKIGNLDIGVVGTLDLIGNMRGIKTLIDWKSSTQIYPLDAIKIAGYKTIWFLMTGEILPTEIVHLKKNGKYALQKPGFYQDSHQDDFLSIVKTWHLLKKYQK